MEGPQDSNTWEHHRTNLSTDGGARQQKMGVKGPTYRSDRTSTQEHANFGGKTFCPLEVSGDVNQAIPTSLHHNI
jgi:hypothetical protein